MQKKLIFIDLDGTLTPTSTWYELNMTLGITSEEDKELFQRYLEQKASYLEWNRALVELYKSRTPVSRTDIESLAASIELRTDAAQIVKALQEKGYAVVMLSGSVDAIVRSVAEKLGVDDWRTTARLVFDDTGTLIDIVASGDEAPAKEKLAETYATDHGYVLADTYAVEDGGNGVELFKKVKGILLGDNESLKPLAWKQVHTLSEIPALL